MAGSSGYKDISRIDNPRRKTHGWYVRVRFKGQAYSKFFSDVVHKGEVRALNMAVRYRNQLEREIGKPRTDRIVMAGHARSGTGVLGVQRITKGTGPAYEVTWSPRPNLIHRTSVSIRKYGEVEAFARACRLRQQKERIVYGRALAADAAPPATANVLLAEAAASAIGAVSKNAARKNSFGQSEPVKTPASKTATAKGATADSATAKRTPASKGKSHKTGTAKKAAPPKAAPARGATRKAATSN